MPLTPESFTNGFCQWVKEAYLPLGLLPHGLRKAVCRRLAEAGSGANEIISISGHRNLREVATYTQAADGQRLAQSAVATVSSSGGRTANKIVKLPVTGLQSYR